MIDFKLFGIPVRIEPWFWLIAFFLGGGIYLNNNSTSSDLIRVLVWMVVIAFSVLVHEFGHALTARRTSGGQNYIRLHGFGGLAIQEGARPTKKDRIWTIAMGPGTGFILFAISVIATFLVLGPSLGTTLLQVILPFQEPSSAEAVVELRSYLQTNPPFVQLIEPLLLVNFWWSIFNLLPIFPLDGGQLFSTITGNTLLAYKVGVVVGVIAAILMFRFTGSLWNTALVGLLAYQNFKSLKNIGGANSWR